MFYSEGGLSYTENRSEVTSKWISCKEEINWISRVRVITNENFLIGIGEIISCVE